MSTSSDKGYFFSGNFPHFQGNRENKGIFWGGKYLKRIKSFYVLFFICFSTKVTCSFLLQEKTFNELLELPTLKPRKMTISSTTLIRNRFQVYRCESGIFIYMPFKVKLRLKLIPTKAKATAFSTFFSSSFYLFF